MCQVFMKLSIYFFIFIPSTLFSLLDKAIGIIYNKGFSKILTHPAQLAQYFTVKFLCGYPRLP